MFEIDIKGMPITMTGFITLKPIKKGCEYIIESEVKCGIPLVGGKILSIVERDTRDNQKLDYEFTRKYLKNLSIFNYLRILFMKNGILPFYHNGFNAWEHVSDHQNRSALKPSLFPCSWIILFSKPL